MSRDKILHDSWSISAALARGFSERHFERGEGPGDEVGQSSPVEFLFFFLVLFLEGCFRSTSFSRSSATALDRKYVSTFFWPRIRSGFLVVSYISGVVHYCNFSYLSTMTWKSVGIFSND